MRLFALRTLVVMAVALLTLGSLAHGDDSVPLGFWRVVWHEFTDGLGTHHAEFAVGGQLSRHKDKDALELNVDYQDYAWPELRRRGKVYAQTHTLRVTETTSWDPRHPVPPKEVQDQINAQRAPLTLKVWPDGEGRMRGTCTQWSVTWRGKQLTPPVRLKDRSFTMQRVKFTAKAVPLDGERPIEEAGFGSLFQVRFAPDIAYPNDYVWFHVRIGDDIWMFDERRRHGFNAVKGRGGAAYRSPRFEFVKEGEKKFAAVQDAEGTWICRIVAAPGETLEVALAGDPWTKVVTVADGGSREYPSFDLVPLVLEPRVFRLPLSRDQARELAASIPSATRRLLPPLDGDWELLLVHAPHLTEQFGRAFGLPPGPPVAGGLRPTQLRSLEEKPAYRSVMVVGSLPQDAWTEFDRIILAHERVQRIVPPKPPGVDFVPSGAAAEQLLAVVAVPTPGQPAGICKFALGEAELAWILPEATTSADLRFLRPGIDVPNPHERDEELGLLLRNDCFVVEIETERPLPLEVIPFHLLFCAPGRDLAPVGRKAGAEVFLAWRQRPGGTTYRSKPIFENRGGENAWRSNGEYLLALEAGGRLTATLAPNVYVRTGRMPVVPVGTAPDGVGTFWREAVLQALRMSQHGFEDLNLEDFGTWSRQKMNDHLTLPWRRVHGRDLQVGDLAAMLLIREKFLERAQASLDAVVKARAALEEPRGLLPQNLRASRPPPDHKAIDALFEEWGHLARAPYSPYGSEKVRVSSPASYGGISLTMSEMYAPGHLERVYDDEQFRSKVDNTRILDTRLPDAYIPEKREWVTTVKWIAVNQMLRKHERSARHAIDKARKSVQHGSTLHVPSPEALLEATGVGMEPIARELLPHLLYLEASQTASPRFQWKRDLPARAFVGGIAAKSELLRADQEIRARWLDIANLAASAVGLPGMWSKAVWARVLAASGSGVSLALTAHGWLDGLERNDEVRFARGAAAVIGPERYFAATLRTKPGWTYIMDLVGGIVDLRALTAEVRALGRVEVPARPASVPAPDLPNGGLELDPGAVEALRGGASQFVALPREQQLRAAGMYVELLRRAETIQLVPLEAQLLRSGDRLMRALERAEAGTARVLSPEVLDEAVSTTTRSGHRFAVTPRVARGVAPTAPGPAGHGPLPSGDLQRLRAFLAPPSSEFLLTPHTTWNGLRVGNRINRGGFTSVYELLDEAGAVTDKVLKVGIRLEHAADDLARMNHCQELVRDLDCHYPIRALLTEVEWHGKAREAVFVVQDRAMNARFLSPHAARPMEREHAVAICMLYKRLARAGVVWTDGHLGNIALVERAVDGKPLVTARIVDLDHMWRWEDSFLTGPCSSQRGHIMDAYEFGADCQIESLRGATITADMAEDLAGEGRHIFPNAEFFMMKMLEKHGYVRFIPGKGWADGTMRLADVLEVFKDLTNPRYVNPDLPGLRTGWLAPRQAAPSWPARFALHTRERLAA